MKEKGIIFKIRQYVKLVRVKQWIKNLFVFSALIFAEYLFEPTYLIKSTLAFIAFCLVSSCVYIINDIIDTERDKLHPKKKFRPLALGTISKNEAITLLVILIPIVGALSLKLGSGFSFAVLLYLVNNIIYSFYLKNRVILDVMSIALGFIIRVISGAVVINVKISPWILLCTLLLSLFLGFSKRRNELVLLEDGANSHRKILGEYSKEFIDNMLSIVTSTTVMAYSLYTVFSRDDYYLMITIPFVLYGIFRYQYIIYQKNEGGSPEEIIFSDLPFLINILMWGACSVGILYLGMTK